MKFPLKPEKNEGSQKTQLTVNTFQNKEMVKQDDAEIPQPNLWPMREGVHDCTANDVRSVEDPMSITRMSNTYASNVLIFDHIFEQKKENYSKVKAITRDQAIIDGMSKMLKEMEDMKNEMHGLKTEVCGMKYQMRFIYGNRI